MTAAVIGSGGWGTALALQLLRNGHDTVLWSHNPEKAESMALTRENPMLPGIPLPKNLALTADAECAKNREIVVLASPSFAIRPICRAVAPYISEKAAVVCVTKGIEPESLLRMSQVVQQETGRTAVVLTGPSHAEEVARNIPTGLLAACQEREAAEFVQDCFMSDTLRVYTSPDVIGAELGGALKNVIALCAGISDGQGYGDNSKAMLMTRGLTEIARLGVSMGASKETFAGLAGVGDLIVTCTSIHSRNRRAGILIGQGKSPQAAMQEIGSVVEGYYAARAAWELSQRQQVEMPIVKAAYQVLYQGLRAGEAVQNLLLRRRKAEPEDAGWL